MITLFDNIIAFGKSNSSYGRWFVKTKDQQFHYFWNKSDMHEFIANTG